MQISISAIDTLFFRDGRPFSMGEESWARGLFPPLPSVFSGLVRTAFMCSQSLAVEEVLQKTTGLSIQAALLSDGRQLLLPMPKSLLPYESGGRIELQALHLVPHDGLSSYSLPMLLESPRDGKIAKASFSFLEEEAFKKYLAGEEIVPYSDTAAEAMSTEPKVGIGRDKSTHIVRESMLYRVNMERMESPDGQKRLFFIIGFDGLNIPPSGIIRMGAEGKTVQYHSLEKPFDIPLPEISRPLLKLFLATPAQFEGGWRPAWLPADGSWGNWQGRKVRLLAAAVDKPLAAGGFDLETGTPKPMYKAVAAGSVYYLQTASAEDARHIASKIHGTCISEYGKSQEGFGLCYVGAVGEHQLSKTAFEEQLEK